MRSRLQNLLRKHFALSLKCGSVLFLLAMSVLVVACGANNTAQVPGAPPVTVTINLNQSFSSPTPPLAPYACGAWATQTTPAYYPNSFVGVYAKFVQNVDGNPVGMPNAQAQATIYWPNGTATTMNATTKNDGLAVFQVPLQQMAVGHVVRVAVVFTSSDGQHTCTIKDDQSAYFTAILSSPTAQPSPTPTSGPPNPFPSVTPSGVPTFPGPPFRRTPTPTP